MTGGDGAPARGDAPRILVAEDNGINQEVIRKILEKMGYGVTTVDNGRKALDVLTAAKFQLVVMDCQMPEMDGWEAARRLRRGECGPLNREAPIMALTAYAMEDDRRRCREAGMDEYCTKPIDIKIFGEILHRRLGTSLEGEDAHKTAPPHPDGGTPAASSAPVFDRQDFLAGSWETPGWRRRLRQLFLMICPARSRP